MNTIPAVTPTERTFWRPSSPAQWAYAAGCAVLTAGMLAIAAPGVPSFTLGRLVLAGFSVAFLLGAALEGSLGTALCVTAGGFIANYVIVTSTHDHTYSHATLAGQFAVMVATVLLVSVWWNRKQGVEVARRERNAR